MTESQQVRRHALLEDQDQQPVGGAHGQQIHDDGLDRDDDGSEDQHQHDEAESKDEEEDEGCVDLNDFKYVRRDRGDAADQDIRGDAFKRRRDVLVAQSRDGVDRRLAARLPVDNQRQERQVTRLVDGWNRRNREPGVIAERGLQALNGALDLGTVDVAVNHDFDRIDDADEKFSSRT